MLYAIITRNSHPLQLQVINPPLIKMCYSNNSIRANYTKMFNTVLYIVEEDEAIKKFPKLVKLQKDNGLKLNAGKDNDKAAAEIIDCLYEQMIHEIKMIMNKARFFAVEFDGSCSKKTTVEMELVYVKVMVSTLITK